MGYEMWNKNLAYKGKKNNNNILDMVNVRYSFFLSLFFSSTLWLCTFKTMKSNTMKANIYIYYIHWYGKMDLLCAIKTQHKFFQIFHWSLVNLKPTNRQRKREKKIDDILDLSSFLRSVFAHRRIWLCTCTEYESTKSLLSKAAVCSQIDKSI